MHPEHIPRESQASAPRRRRRTAGLAVAVVVALLAGPAQAQENLDEDPPRTAEEQAAADDVLEETLEQAPESPPSPDDPFADVVETAQLVDEAALVRMSATAKSNEANVRAFQAAEELTKAREREDQAVEARDAAIAELALERDRLSRLTVRAYVTGGDADVEQYRAILAGDTTDVTGGRELLFSQVLDRQKEITEEASTALKAARAKLREARAVVDEAETNTDRLLEAASERSQARVVAERAHREALADAAAATERLRVAGSGPTVAVPEDVAIIGVPRLAAEDLAGWFASSPYRPRVKTPIEDYARWFIEEGATEGIRGDIAFAQAVLETGGFANNDSVNANNFSGIGHCDTCPTGWTFPSPRMGVRAQIQLLKSYAVKKPTYVNELVDRRLRGPAGCCDTWGDLTTVWATDPTYGPKVMFLYAAMVDYALDRRARGESGEPDAP